MLSQKISKSVAFGLFKLPRINPATYQDLPPKETTINDLGKLRKKSEKRAFPRKKAQIPFSSEKNLKGFPGESFLERLP